MGCQEYLVNDTRKEVYRIGNSGHWNIFREIALALKNNPTWSSDDEVELFVIEYGMGSVDQMRDLLLCENYACNDPTRFLDGNDLHKYLNPDEPSQ